MIFTPRKSGAYVILMHAKEVHRIPLSAAFFLKKPATNLRLFHVYGLQNLFHPFLPYIITLRL
jgi:hypothetical protein